MTNRIYTTAFTVPAKTAIASPALQAVTLDDVTLDAVRIVIAPGHAALTGLAIYWAGTIIAPYGAGTWFTGDNEIIDYPFDGEITEFGLQLRGYNLDIFQHTFALRWLVTERPTGGPVSVSSVQLGTVGTSGDQSQIASLSSDTTGQGSLLVPTDQQTGALVPDLTGSTQ